MRSRYSAYVQGDVDYVMRTTHRSSPHRGGDEWADELRSFCELTTFGGLDIVEAPEPAGDEGTVTFTATLSQGGRDVSFTERSRFERVDGIWLYLDGRPAPITSR